MFDKITKRIVSFLTAAVMSTSNVMAITPIRAVDEEPDLTYQSIELYPNGEDAEQIVTLDGMMPDGAKAKAVDVSVDYEGMAAYDITIKDGWKEYQPGEENPILVEITDPVITESIELWHIHDDGSREQIFDFTAEEGKVSFYATGFSVYEIVDNGFNFSITYDKVPVSGDTDFSVFEVNQVGEQEPFVYDVVNKNYRDVRGTVTQVSSLSDLQSYITNGNGFYISSVKTGFFAKNYQENDLKIYKDAGRTGIAITDSYNTTDSLGNMFNAYNAGAKKFYFEKTAQNEDYYYIYTYGNESDLTSKKYVGHVSGKNRLYLTNDSNNTTQTAKTKWTVGYDSTNACFYFKDTNVSWYWNETYESGKPNYGFSAYSDGPDKDQGARFQLWLYTPADLSTDPYELNGNTYGLVNYQNTTKGNALLAGNYNNTGTQLGNNPYLTPDSATPSKYTSSYGISGWQFEWIPNTVNYKVSAIADDGATRKYLKLDSTGVSLVDETEATVLTVEPNSANRIKLKAGANAINRNSDTNFNRANDETGAALYFDLVDVSPYTTDTLGLGGNTYGLINYQNATTGNAMMASAYSAVKLNNQMVTSGTNSNGDIEYTYLGDVSKWIFTHVESNRYVISTVTDEGTKYLKLVKDSLALSETPFILSVIAGTGDYIGKVKISNATDKQDIYRNSNTSFDYTGTSSYNNASKWFHLVTVPDAPTSDPLGLDGNTYGIVGINNNKYYAMQAELNSSSQLLGTQVTLNSDGKFELSNNVISGWTFHWVNRANYKITDSFGRYIKLNGTTSISLVDDADEASILAVNLGTGDNAGKIQLIDLSLNRYITCWNTFVNHSGAGYFDLVSLANQVDPLKLNGKTFGLVNYTGGTSGNALIADGGSHYTKLYQISSRSHADPTQTKTLYVPSESDITMWTFENISEDYYRLKTDKGTYLKSDGTALSIVNSPDDATEFRITATTSGGHTAVTLQSNGMYIAFDTNQFTVSAAGTPLCFVQKAELSEDDEITYTADRISVSDGERAYNGAQLIVYTRIWDDTNKKYDFYAIDHDGSLKQCYAYGDKLMWKGDVMNTLLWNFTVYYDKGKENGYYELQNVYSGKYLAPQLPKNGQILQDTKIGIQLPGRKYEKDENNVYTYGEYYSHIIAWDESHYDYASLRAEAKKKDTATGNTIFSDVYANADTFYFATLDSIDSATSGLHEVKTLVNSDYGIKMRVVDFLPNNTTSSTGSDYSEITSSYFGGSTSNQKGLLSTDLDEDGHPTVKKGNVGADFGDAFNNAVYADNLFIESIHESSGYFEFDSCQNFATLVANGNGLSQKKDKHGNYLYLNSLGELTTVNTGNPVYDFTVYRELGTMESHMPTRMHGQFLPYNYIKPGEISSLNPQNMYDVLSLYNDWEFGELDDSNPRKFEELYTVFRKNGEQEVQQPDYCLGMELEAKFVQTPSGLDAWGHDVIFEFTGDDDFWLYVDGELVLDLGGIHSAEEGKVNFRTGTVVYDIDDASIAQNKRKRKTTTLKDIFYNNYLSRNHTTAEAEEFVLKQYCPDGNGGGGVRKLTLEEFKNAALYLNEYNNYKDSHTSEELNSYLTAICTGRTITLDEMIKLYQTAFNEYEAAHGETEAIKYYKSLCNRDITVDEFRTLYSEVCTNYTEAHKTTSDAHFTELLAERTITLAEYETLYPEKVEAINAAIAEKKAEQHTAAEAQAYVDSIFEENEDGQFVFKDYTEHSMKVYYMERGAGASNLHMRFNLSAVTPGNVLFAKTMSGATSDVDFSAVQFPFQIQYKYTEEEAEWRNLTNAKDSHDKPSVSYQNSTQTVRYAATYQSPNANKTYQNVFFLIPGRQIEINFPDNAMYYRIIECSVDKDIYTVTASDNDTLEESSDGITVSSGNIKDLITKASQVSDQPTIKFDNGINSDNIRSLNITKHLYAGNDKTQRLRYADDQTTFNYRVYLANATDEELTLANMHDYYVLDPNYYVCEWDADQQKFVRYDPPTTVNEISTLSADNKNKITQRTSQYGSISKIPVDYTVRLPGLLAGTRFLVEERDYELPVGYDLLDYECKTGQFTDENNTSTGLASYTVNKTYKYDGKEYTVEGTKYYNSAGTIKAGYQAEVIVNNYKGYGLKVEKQWTDEDFTESHGDIYVGLYVNGKSTPNEIRRIQSPYTTAQFFFENLESGKTLSDYHVFEVELTNPTVDSSGKVTGYGSIEKKDSEHPVMTLPVRNNGAESDITDEYTVSYPPATDKEAALLLAQGNARKEMIRNTRKGGIEINLHKWNNTANADEPLAGGEFLLKCSGDENGVVYTSDASGNVTVQYGIQANEDYTLEQIASPTGYVAMKEPVTFTVQSDGNGNYNIIMTNPNDKDNDQIHTVADGKNWAEYDSPSGVLAGKIDIYNKPYTLKILKVENGTGTGLPGVEFSLYRAVMLYGGLVKDFHPLPGYESLMTSDGTDGLERGQIPQVDNTLIPRKYYLTEKTPLDGYEGMSKDLVLTITNTGTIEIEDEAQSGYLQTLNSDDLSSVTYVINVPNDVGTHDYYFNIEKNIFVDKNVHSSDEEQKFVFRVERFAENDTAMNAVLDSFYLTLNCENNDLSAHPSASVLSAFTNHSFDADEKTVTVTYTDGSYSFPTSICQGLQSVKVNQKGIYRITEVTNWSSTDYDFWTGSNTFRSSDSGRTVLGEGTSAVINNVNDIYNHCPYVAFTVTDADTAKDACPVISFTNTETEYAHLSSQAYAENTITRN